MVKLYCTFRKIIKYMQMYSFGVYGATNSIVSFALWRWAVKLFSIVTATSIIGQLLFSSIGNVLQFCIELFYSKTKVDIMLTSTESYYCIGLYYINNLRVHGRSAVLKGVQVTLLQKIRFFMEKKVCEKNILYLNFMI